MLQQAKGPPGAAEALIVDEAGCVYALRWGMGRPPGWSLVLDPRQTGGSVPDAMTDFVRIVRDGDAAAAADPPVLNKSGGAEVCPLCDGSKQVTDDNGQRVRCPLCQGDA